MGCSDYRKLINVGIVISPLTILFVVLGFATDYWLEVDVDRSDLSAIELTLSNSNQEMARYYHSRHRGILRECYPENSATFLDEASKVVSDNCFYLNFDDPDKDISAKYQQRMHLMRTTLALYVLGLVAVIVTFFVGLALCFTKSRHVSHGASLLSFVGGLLVLSSLVMFHATEYVEANKDGDAGELLFQNTWTKNLLKATSTQFGYSYALAWVGLLLALFNGIIFLLAARALHCRNMDYSDSDSMSSSDREVVIKKSRVSSNGSNPKRPKSSHDFYDNYGGYPVYGSHPAFFQSVPAYPAITYGNSIYSTPEAASFVYDG